MQGHLSILVQAMPNRHSLYVVYVQAKGNPLDPVTMGALCGAYGLAGKAEVQLLRTSVGLK